MRKKILALLLIVCMLASMVVTTATAAEIGDVPDDHWAKESAERWVGHGVMEVDENGNFNLEQEMTRAEFAVLMCKLMGYKEMADASTFSDLPEDKAAADALLKLAKAGVMLGVGDGKAGPDGKLTREQVAVMVFRALKLKPVANTDLTFADSADVSDWAKAEMATMASLKMVEGVGSNTLAPQNNIANQDMAALLDKMVAAYVTENGATVDTSKAANPNGVVIIKANNVKIANAADSTAVVVTEDAPKNAAVTVTGAASDITVAAEGVKVNVAKDAEVASVTVEAPNASVTVNGTVGDVAVTADAESAKVTVAKGAEVGSVAVEAPKTAVTVTGTVGDVAVAAGADNTTVTAMSGAKVDSVTTSAEGVKVNGAKDTIGTVVADAGSAEVKAKGAEVTNSGADSVKVDNKVVADGSTTTSNQAGSGTSSGGSSGGGYVPSEPVTPPAEMKTLDVSIYENNVAGHGFVAPESASYEVGKQVTVTLTGKKNIAVVLTYEGADKNGTKPSVTQTGTAAEGYTYTITFDMPGTDARLVIGVLNACEDNYKPAAGLSACFGGDNNDQGVLTDGLGENWGTQVPDEPAPSDASPDANGAEQAE